MVYIFHNSLPRCLVGGAHVRVQPHLWVLGGGIGREGEKDVVESRLRVGQHGDVGDDTRAGILRESSQGSGSLLLDFLRQEWPVLDAYSLHIYIGGLCLRIFNT